MRKYKLIPFDQWIVQDIKCALDKKVFDILIKNTSESEKEEEYKQLFLSDNIKKVDIFLPAKETENPKNPVIDVNALQIGGSLEDNKKNKK